MTLIECLRSEGIRSALEQAAIAQKLGQVACFIDRQVSTCWLDMARELGVDLAHLLVAQPDTDVQVEDLIGHLERTRVVSLTIVA